MDPPQKYFCGGPIQIEHGEAYANIKQRYSFVAQQ